jgi:hypothetical protein
MVYIPSVGYSSVSDDDGFREFFSLVTHLREAGERVFWYVVMPTWVTDGLRGNDRMNYVRMDSTRDVSLNNLVGFPAFELAQSFSRRGGRYIVDGVLTNCSNFGLYMRQLLSDRSRKVSSMPVFIRDKYDIPESSDEKMLFVSNHVGCRTLVRSESEMREISNVIGRCSNPSLQKAFLDSSIIWPVGYDLTRHPERRKNDEIALFIGGEFGEYAAKKAVLKATEKLFMSGRISIVIASTSPRSKVEGILPGKDSSFVSQFLPGLSKIEYEKEVESAHVFVSVTGKGSPFDEFEEEVHRLLLGQIGVFPLTGLSLEILGSEYPFLYNQGKVDEAICLVEWIAENYKEAIELINPFIEKIRGSRETKSISLRVWSEMKKVIDSSYRISHMKESKDGKRKPLFTTIYSIASKLGKEFALDVFLDILEEHVTWLKPWGNKGALQEIGKIGHVLPTLYDIREMMDNLGWVDTCEGQRIMLRKERDPLPGVLDAKETA